MFNFFFVVFLFFFSTSTQYCKNQIIISTVSSFSSSKLSKYGHSQVQNAIKIIKQRRVENNIVSSHSTTKLSPNRNAPEQYGQSIDEEFWPHLLAEYVIEVV